MPTDQTDLEGTARDNLAAVVDDVEGEARTTRYAYDSRGNVVRVTKPNQHVTELTVNQRDQVIRLVERQVERTLADVAPPVPNALPGRPAPGSPITSMNCRGPASSTRSPWPPRRRPPRS